MRESSIESRCREFVESMGGQLIKLSTRNGIPDRMALIPGGLVMFAEFKAPGKIPRKLQEYNLRMLRSLGFNAGYFDDVDKFKLAIQDLQEDQHFSS